MKSCPSWSVFGASIVLVLVAAADAFASGHGPVFGLTTPTNARGGWAFDLGFMGRKGTDDVAAMLRAMLSYGITEDVQVSVSAPVVFSSAPLMPGRMTAMMPGTGDVEAIGAWRFHRQSVGVGSRLESTAYGGLILPGPQRPAGKAGELRKAVGTYAAISSGYASRSHYVWGGAGNTRFAESQGDRRPGLFIYSFVWGYRPPALRKEYPDWDWRVFAEITGERAGTMRRQGIDVPGTGGHQLFLGPTTLGIYKNFAVEGGVQFPIYRAVGSLQQTETFRFAVNISYFF